MVLIIMSVLAVGSICLMVGLRINLTKTIAMCERCKHSQAKCVECMASRATYD